VIGAFYYLRVIRAMYFDEPESVDGGVPMTQREDLSLRIVFAANALSLLVLGLAWNPMMVWCQKAFV
jgi:NADH-quinone oxidoreductase subunit N